MSRSKKVIGKFIGTAKENKFFDLVGSCATLYRKEDHDRYRLFKKPKKSFSLAELFLYCEWVSIF